MKPVAVLDASAFLAYLQGENGAEKVAAVLCETACISAVNWLEVLRKLYDRGINPKQAIDVIKKHVCFESSLIIIPVDKEIALYAAQLQPFAKEKGLSLGDITCLALGQFKNIPVLTADRIWKTLKSSIEIQLIR